MTSGIDASLEAIAFQMNGKLLDNLTDCFDRIIESKADLAVITREHDLIEEMTFSTTGIRMAYRIMKSRGVNFETPYLIEVEMFNANALNVINPAALKKLRGYDLDNLNVYDSLQGSIDLKNARVSGIFSEIQNVFVGNVKNYNGYFTGAELAALYLHEVGHAWAMYFYMGETLITNTILAEVVGRIDTEETVEKKFLVGKAAIKLSGGKSTKDVAEMTTDEITAVVLEGQMARMQQRTGSRWYDIRLAEALADQFASRWLAGAPLVTALGKLERSKNIFFSATGFDPIWVGLSSNFFTVAMLPFKMVKVGEVAKYVLETSARPILMKIAKAFCSSVALGSINQFTGTHKRYDTWEQRFAAIRRELVTLLKDRDLSPEIRKSALADIEVIDSEIAKIHPYGDIMSKLAKWSWRTVTGRKQELDRHHNAEELANNRLYELSALFKD